MRAKEYLQRTLRVRHRSTGGGRGRTADGGGRGVGAFFSFLFFGLNTSSICFLIAVAPNCSGSLLTLAFQALKGQRVFIKISSKSTF